MPSWNIHLEAGKRLQKKLKFSGMKQKEFLLGCLLPDINNGYINKVKKKKEHSETHYAYDQKAHYYDFDADVDLQILKSWTDTSPSFWDNWKNYGLGSALSGGPTEGSRELAPIIILKASDLTGTDKEIADRLCINIKDVKSLMAEYNTAKSNNEEIVLFRFATSDYYSEFVDVYEKNGGFLWADKIYEDEVYIAKESVFLDFDIIQLTFHKEGKYTVIPAVSNPIDIVNDITTPVHNEPELEWWKIALIIIGAVIVLILFFPLIVKVLGYIVYFTLRLLFLPLELIVLLIKKIRERKE